MKPGEWESRVGSLWSRLGILELAAHRAGLPEADRALRQARKAVEPVGAIRPGSDVLELERLVEPAIAALIESPAQLSTFVLDAASEVLLTLQDLREVHFVEGA